VLLNKLNERNVMNDSSLIAGSLEIEIDGRTYRCSRLKLRDYVELEQRFAATRPDAMACAKAHLTALSEPLQRRLLELAFEAALRPSSPTVEELRRWLLGCEGLSVALELSLRAAGSVVTAEQCRRAVYQSSGARRGELLRVVAEATGIPLEEERDAGNERCRGAAASASAGLAAAASDDERDSDQEPDWIGERYATD